MGACDLGTGGWLLAQLDRPRPFPNQDAGGAQAVGGGGRGFSAGLSHTAPSPVVGSASEDPPPPGAMKL